jgi:hypothetical protein
MYYKPMNPRLVSSVNINYYPKNKFGVDLVKTWINIIDSPSVVVVFADKKIIHSQIVYLLSGMYEMQWSIIYIFKHRIVRIQKMITICWLIHKTW